MAAISLLVCCGFVSEGVGGRETHELDVGVVVVPPGRDVCGVCRWRGRATAPVVYDAQVDRRAPAATNLEVLAHPSPHSKPPTEARARPPAPDAAQKPGAARSSTLNSKSWPRVVHGGTLSLPLLLPPCPHRVTTSCVPHSPLSLPPNHANSSTAPNTAPLPQSSTTHTNTWFRILIPILHSLTHPSHPNPPRAGRDTHQCSSRPRPARASAW